MAAYMQKERSAGICVVDPIPKAMKLVSEVMVIATPACSIVLPSLSATPPELQRKKCQKNIGPKKCCRFYEFYADYSMINLFYLRCSWLSVFLHWTMTNMSSIPMPSMRKGMTVWAGEYQNPMAEHTP